MPIRGVQEAGCEDGRATGGEGWGEEQLMVLCDIVHMAEYMVFKNTPWCK
jgi:hypothetical protein